MGLVVGGVGVGIEYSVSHLLIFLFNNKVESNAFQSLHYYR